jgi:hypothetical protein
MNMPSPFDQFTSIFYRWSVESFLLFLNFRELGLYACLIMSLILFTGCLYFREFCVADLTLTGPHTALFFLRHVFMSSFLHVNVMSSCCHVFMSSCLHVVMSSRLAAKHI